MARWFRSEGHFPSFYSTIYAEDPEGYLVDVPTGLGTVTCAWVNKSSLISSRDDEIIAEMERGVPNRDVW